MPTPDRLEEIKRIRNCVPFIDNGAGVIETQAAIDDLLAALDAHREAVRVAASQLNRALDDKNGAECGGLIYDVEMDIRKKIKANPILSAAIREEQAKKEAAR